jgi:CBS domain-containing protein
MILKNSSLDQLIIRKPITISPDTTLLESRDILLRHRIRRLIVADTKNTPVGMVTEKDIAKAIFTSNHKDIQKITASEFMAKNLATTTHDDSIYDCAKIMKNRGISSVIIIKKDGTLDGIVTKTDLASVFLTKATGSLPISKIMTRKVITVMPNDSLLFAESLLLKYKIARIVVQRNRIPVGIITLRDFVPAKIPRWIADSADPKELDEYRQKTYPSEFQQNQQRYLLPFKAVDIMSPNPITIESSQDVSAAVLLMIRHDISGIPVVKRSKLVGIITKSDVVRVIAEH